ncbi:uncharacterized protein LOC122853929 [Aphidius gifuensis]|uniref:uncharacterized protein LOC122853929 n=1 Tax=Aphidius gifuensis TaxID=684658 RepID=UPI001CDCE103|nr:uncharacterized protein LOC122853929 [Aphidius gifuensis]
METVAVDDQWIETFKTISIEEINSPTKINKYEIPTNFDCEEFQKMMTEKCEKISEQRKIRMKRMKPLFASQPRLQMICRDWHNGFLDSGFTTYIFYGATVISFKRQEIDLKYVINLCGYNLTELRLYDYHGGLHVDEYPCSQLMPLIKSNCFNLTKLVLRFKEMESNDCDNVFSNMSHLEELSIYRECENSTLPMTLIKSLEHVCETLKTLVIICHPEPLSYPYQVPVSSVSSVLSPETEALLTVISSMKNLESTTIRLDYGFTDEFFINLINNSKNLKNLNICGSNITDKGLIAIDKLHQLKITNSSVIELVKNLPNLETLYIQNTKATIELVEEITKLTEDRQRKLTVWVSFKMNDNNDSPATVINPALTFIDTIGSLGYLKSTQALQKKNDGTPLSLSTFNTPGSIKKTPGILAPTPAKNKVNINPETSIDGAQTPAEQKQLKQQSSLNLGALPAPKNHYQIVIPDNEITDETADNQDDDIIEDQADIDARK